MFSICIDGKSVYQPIDRRHVLLAPKVTLERGKAGSLTFRIPPSHPEYNSFQPLKTRITVSMDDEEIFRGRVLSNNRNMENIRAVYCEGELAYLVDTVQKAEKYEGTVHALFHRIVAAHNQRVEADKQFVVGEITVEDREVLLAGQSEEIEDAETGSFDYNQISINSVADNWNKTLDYIQKCLIDYTGGFLRVRRQNGINYIDYLDDDYGTESVQDIEFGKNLLDITEETSPEEMFTVLIPLGDENLTIESVNNGSDELVNEEGVALYGRIIRTEVFDSVTSPDTLIENGRRYMELHSKMQITITAKAIDMHLVDPNARPIHVGDKVRVISEPHGMSFVLACIKIEYDLENPANNTYVFGSEKPGLTERYRKDKKEAQKETSRSRAGGGGAGSAAAEEAQQQLDKFYDAWINFDKNTAHVSLGAVYKELQNTKDVLVNQVGIDLDAPSGNVNIYNLRQSFDELGNIVQTQSVTINSLNTETKAQLEMITALDTRESQHAASLVLRADSMESVLEGKADTIVLKSLEQELKSEMDNLSAGLSSKVDIQTLEDGYLTKDAASKVYATVSNVNSALETKANVALLDGYLTKTAAADVYATISDLTAGLNTKVETSTMSGYLTKSAAAELYATDEDVTASIKAYVVTSGSASKTFAEILADLTKVTGRLEIGDTTTVKGGLYASGGIGAAGQMTASGGLQVIGNFTLGSESITKENLTIVTDFTQASTPGWTANPVSKTLLATSVGDAVNHNIASGEAMLFN